MLFRRLLRIKFAVKRRYRVPESTFTAGECIDDERFGQCSEFWIGLVNRFEPIEFGLD
jgi:hypothetical protein